MKAVLDTNILISAALVTGGGPHRILEASKHGKFEFVTSETLLDELESVLARRRIARRLGWSEGDRSEFLQGIEESATVLSPREAIAGVAADPDDDRVLEAAVEGRADYIVTGDRDLLDVGEHEGTKIVTPAKFLDILTVDAENL